MARRRDAAETIRLKVRYGDGGGLSRGRFRGGSRLTGADGGRVGGGQEE